MTTPRTTDRALGIIATGRRIDAVLLQAGADGPVAVRLFSRPRTRGRGDAGAGMAPESGLDAPEGLPTDVTLSFGDGEGGNPELFLGSEFAGLGATATADQQVKPVDTFELELADLLDEFHSLGEADGGLAFSLHAGDTEHVSLHVPEARTSADREPLLGALRAAYQGEVDDDRVAFVPMTPSDDGERRYLAVFPAPSAPVAPTLRKLVDQGERLPDTGMLDAEAMAYVSLVRLAPAEVEEKPAPKAAAVALEEGGDASAEDAEGLEELPAAAEPTSTLIVRAGMEDTLLVSLHGETVQYCETLQSLTAFDVPDTLCSRILLQQDEHGVATPQRILVLSEEREGDLIKAFSRFFPEASVGSMRGLLPVKGMPEEGPAAVLAAATAALRLMPGYAGRNAFVPVDFMPRKLLKRRMRVPVNVPALALSVLVILSVLFLFTSYSQAADEIAERERRLSGVAELDLSQDVNVLQAQIDSMRSQHARYLHALTVLDSLLAGSDQWSRVLEEVSKYTAEVEGIWVESMTPQGGSVRLQGNATARQRVVSFARRVSGTIETLTFSEIREWPVYSFSILVPVERGLPEAAHFLRQQVVVAQADTSSAPSPAAARQGPETLAPVSGDTVSATASPVDARASR